MIIKNMERENMFGLTKGAIKDITEMIKSMVKEPIFGLMEGNISGNGGMTKDMEEESTTLMQKDTMFDKASGNKIVELNG